MPPGDLTTLPRSPLELVFTLDVSGSMSGRPIEQAKAAVRYALTHMGPDDTFQVIRFANTAEASAPRPVAATPENVRAALLYLEGTSPGGGTLMLDGMKRSLEIPADPSRPRCVAFLTDGFIGNDVQVLGALRGALGSSRVFGFGVGPAVNRYLLESMARLGSGAVAFIGPNDPADEAMAAWLGRISRPALTDISIDWGGAEVVDVLPRRIPDLFVGRPVLLTGRFTGEPPAVVKVIGKVRGEEHALQVVVTPAEAPGGEQALSRVWARMKIADLADRSVAEPSPQWAQQARQVALDHGLVSPYTAFLAVDSLTRTEGTHGTTVSVPVPVPEGVRYQTTVTE